MTKVNARDLSQRCTKGSFLHFSCDYLSRHGAGGQGALSSQGSGADIELPHPDLMLIRTNRTIVIFPYREVSGVNDSTNVHMLYLPALCVGALLRDALLLAGNMWGP